MSRRLDYLAWQAVPEGRKVGRTDIGKAVGSDGGSLSQLLERMVRTGRFTVHREPRASRAAQGTFYRRVEGATPPAEAPKRQSPASRTKVTALAKVVAKVAKRAEPLPPVVRIASVWDFADKTTREAQCA